MRVPVIGNYSCQRSNHFSVMGRCSKNSPKNNYMAQCSDTVDFGCRIPKETSVAYFNIINTLSREIKAIGAPIYIFNDGSQKALLIAQQVKKSMLEIKAKGIEFPKMKIHFDSWDELFDERAAAETESKICHDKAAGLAINFNTPLYRNISKEGFLCRNSKQSFETSLDIDFKHEFAHAYQSFFNHKNYSKIKDEGFSEEINQEISEKLTDIASLNKAEFIAEYFAHKMSGKEIQSERLAKLYEECLGPKVD